MTVGIVGLGLIGGSLARAYHDAGWRVLAHNRSASVTEFAEMAGAVDAALTPENLSECGLLLLAVYPQASIDYLEANAERINQNAVVIDCCGTKRDICAVGFRLAQEHGFLFVGGHPMAGRERSGFTAATEDLYVGASMILTPDDKTDMPLLETLKHFFLDVGFGSLTFSTPEEHDRIIAFTSQLAHIVSSAYIKSPEAQRRRGFSAGSFRDMTRVARLDEDMWTELMLSDADYLVKELGILIENITAYKGALERGDESKLRQLLKEGREAKASAGGN